MTPKAIFRGLLMIAVLVVLGFLLREWGIGGVFDKAWVDTHIRGNGSIGELLFLGAAALLATVGFPRQVISFLGGYAFGLNFGVLLGLAATSIGCIIALSFSRFVARDFVSSKFPGRIQRVDKFLEHNTFAMTLLIRLLPVGSNVATNLIAGVSSAGGIAFVGGSTIGYIPQTVVFALLGSGINLDPELRISLSVALFFVSAALGVFLYRRYKRGKGLNGGLGEGLG